GGLRGVGGGGQVAGAGRYAPGGPGGRLSPRRGARGLATAGLGGGLSGGGLRLPWRRPERSGLPRHSRGAPTGVRYPRDIENGPERRPWPRLKSSEKRVP